MKKNFTFLWIHDNRYSASPLCFDGVQLPEETWDEFTDVFETLNQASWSPSDESIQRLLEIANGVV